MLCGAALTVTPAAAAQMPTLAAEGAVASFYASRQNAPLWLRGGPKSESATELVGILRRAELDGLPNGPQLAAQAEAAIARAQSGNPKDLAAAERLLSTAWVLYVQAITRPTAGVDYGDPTLARKVLPAEQIMLRAYTAYSLTQHLQAVSSVNPIYAQLREAAWNESRISGGGASAVLLANLDRARMLPASGRYILVDVASQRLWTYEDGKPLDSMKVVVGKLEYPTPMIASTIYYATFNPYWHVPEHLIRKTIAPNVIQKGKGYLKTHGYQVLSDWTGSARIVPPEEVDWAAVATGETKIIVRQLPGGDNSMGQIKFQFANDGDVYLHDTPQKELFDKSPRTFSNGCIRLEDAKRLGRWLLGREPVAPSAEPEQHVQLPQRVPVYVTYLTALPTDGKIAFSDDIYGLDQKAKSRVASLAGQTADGAKPAAATP
jgi:murein L,D-transpeptidase YcbB/YkuD